MATKQDVKPSNLNTEDITRKVTLKGTVDIMFDRYAGDNNTKLEPWQKMYLRADRTIYLPNLNILSFLSAQNTPSAPKRLRDKRKYREVTNACQSFIIINPTEIPFLRDGKEIRFGKFDGDVDKQSGVYINRSVARLKDGIPNPKVRPVLPLPWEINFSLTILQNREIKEQEILNLIEEGGRAIGLGTWRGVFGKFSVSAWD